jgi:hypothetical protein
MFVVAGVLGGAALGAAGIGGLTLATGAAVGGALGAGIGGLKSSKASGEAATRAAETQAASAEAANEQQWKMFQQSRQDQLPWLRAGGRALGELEKRVMAGPGEFEAGPGYEFTKAEGERAVDRGLASRGLYGSGKALKELTRFGTGLASQEYDKFLQRHYQSLNPLQSLSGVGQTTGQQLGVEGARTAGVMGGNLMAAGQARGQGYVNQATAQAQGLQGVGTALGTAIQNWPTSTGGQIPQTAPQPAPYGSMWT